MENKKLLKAKTEHKMLDKIIFVIISGYVSDKIEFAVIRGTLRNILDICRSVYGKV